MTVHTPSLTVRSVGLSRALLVAAVAALVAALLSTAPPAQAQPADPDTIQVIGEDEMPSPSEITVRLSRATPLPNPTTVLISRDDNFADAMASGLYQSGAPLFVVPRNGPVPQIVLDEIARLGAQRALIMGGSAAVSPAVEAQLAQAGLVVERRSGASRFDTAVAIARDAAPDADTALLARADTNDPNNPTAGFADTLSAGALAAEHGWPILLTSTGELTAVTRDYLASSEIQRVMIMGGTAAVSQAVEDEIRQMVTSVERVAGASRFGTAVEAAALNGAQSAADVDHVVLVDGTSPQGFVGGFAAAAHAAVNDAPILLVDGIQVPPDTEAFLQPGASFAQAGDPLTVTCVVHPLACDTGREDLGLVDFPLLEVFPPIDSRVEPGQVVQIQLSPPEEGANADVVVKGDCLDGQLELTTDGSGLASFPLTQFPPGGGCAVDVTYGNGADAISQGYNYTFTGNGRSPGSVGVSSEVFAYGTAVPTTPLYVTDDISCSGPAGEAGRQDSAYEARYLHDDGFVETLSLTSFPFEAFEGDTCTATAQVPDGVGRVLWGVYSWADNGLRNPLLLGHGDTATFTFDEIGTGVTDVNVVWILETHQTEIGVPPAPAGGLQGQLFNPEGLDTVCGGQQAGPNLTVQQVGAACDARPPTGGLEVLVVQPGRPLAPEPNPSFTIPAAAFPTAVYTIVTGGGTTGPSCESAPELPFATITAGMTTPAQPVSYHSFFAFEGEDLRFRADNAFGDFETGLDPVLNLYGPDGSLVASNDDGDSRYNSRIDTVDLTEGIYCLEVTGFGGSTGDFLLAADYAPEFVAHEELSAEVPALQETFSGTAGDLVVMEARAPGFAETDPIIELYDASGQLVAANDDGGGFPNSRIEIVLPSSGDFTAVVSTFGERYGPFLYERSVLRVATAARPAA